MAEGRGETLLGSLSLRALQHNCVPSSPITLSLRSSSCFSTLIQLKLQTSPFQIARGGGAVLETRPILPT